MRPAVGLFIFVHKGIDVTLAIKCEDGIKGSSPKTTFIQMLLYWNIMLNYADLNLNQSGQYGQIYAEKFTSASLICKVFYGKMKAQ